MLIGNHKVITVLIGSGKFQDIDGEIQDIQSIRLPTLIDGKHVSVFEDENTTAWRSLEDGKILSFECEKVEHWTV